MRDWSLPTAGAEQAPIPHADARSPQGLGLVVALPPFSCPRWGLTIDNNETAQGVSPWAINRCPVDPQYRPLVRSKAGATLLAKPESRDGRAVALDVLFREVGEQPPPLTDELEEASA